MRRQSVKGKIVFVNPASRIAAAYIGSGKCIVFEYQSANHFKKGEVLNNLRNSYGHVICDRVSIGKKAMVNVLSTVMDQHTAKLVVAPWQDVSHEEFSMAEYAFA